MFEPEGLGFGAAKEKKMREASWAREKRVPLLKLVTMHVHAHV